MPKTPILPFLCAALLLIAAGCREQETISAGGEKQPQATFLKGADISFFPEIEAEGYQYKVNGVSTPLLDILQSKGINAVRLRLWYNPTNGHSGLDEVAGLAKRLKQRGFYFLLDIHFSDTWADPGAQTKPTAWAGVGNAALADSVYAYTRRVMLVLRQQNALPDMVQTGNEINSGMLWDNGRVWGIYNNQWEYFAHLLKQAAKAVKESLPGADIPVLIHYAGLQNLDTFFDYLTYYKVPFDVIGISFYPAWHGKQMEYMAKQLAYLADRYGKPVLVAETAYPFTLQWNDWTNNIIGLPEHLVPGYEATLEGQRKFIADVKESVRNIRAGLGLGVFYWAPEWTAFRGPQAANGSSWENQALFDFSGNATPALDELGR